MVNLKNKYLLKTFNDKFDVSAFSLVCHSFYLTTSELNLLRYHCKKNKIVCFNAKNSIVQYKFKTNNIYSYHNLFVSQNLIFLANDFIKLFELYKTFLNEKTKLIPLVFLYQGQVIVLTNDVLLTKLKNKNISHDLLMFLFFINIQFILYLKQVNLSLFYFIINANINTINKKGACN